jgi:hypothetical protein
MLVCHVDSRVLTGAWWAGVCASSNGGLLFWVRSWFSSAWAQYGKLCNFCAGRQRMMLQQASQSGIRAREMRDVALLYAPKRPHMLQVSAVSTLAKQVYVPRSNVCVLGSSRHFFSRSTVYILKAACLSSAAGVRPSAASIWSENNSMPAALKIRASPTVARVFGVSDL